MAVLVDEDGNATETLYGADALAFFESRGVGPFGDVKERPAVARLQRQFSLTR